MKEIKLKKQIEIKDEKVSKISLDLNSLTGNDLLKAEGMSRELGDKTPAIMYSMRYQSIVAALAANVSVNDILALGANDYTDVLAEVNNFLFA